MKGSPTLPLISPARGGTSILDGVLVEYSIKVPRDGNGSTVGDDDDAELIDGCIECTSRYGIRINLKLKSRIYGPVDMEYAFTMKARRGGGGFRGHTTRL